MLLGACVRSAQQPEFSSYFAAKIHFVLNNLILICNPAKSEISRPKDASEYIHPWLCAKRFSEMVVSGFSLLKFWKKFRAKKRKELLKSHRWLALRASSMSDGERTSKAAPGDGDADDFAEDHEDHLERTRRRRAENPERGGPPKVARVDDYVYSNSKLERFFSNLYFFKTFV